MNRSATIFTVGYHGRRLPQFISLLVANGITRVLDVRELPLSRQKGFSRRTLEEALRAAKIEYVHLRPAGNPYRDRKADIEKCLDLYRRHLAQHPQVLDLVERHLGPEPSALLCLEAIASQCHRSVIAVALQERRPDRRVRDL